jgi:hypothetical protein
MIASVVDALELVSVLFLGADLGKLQSEQREAGLLVVLSAQVGGDLVDDEFGGRSDARGDQMPAAGCAVSRSEHNVGVDSGCAVLFCNVAVERQQFDLFEDRDLSKLVCFPVKPTHCGSGEAADAGQARGCDPLLSAPACELPDELVSNVEHEHELCAVLGPR